MKKIKTKVLIIGAGPAGIACAVQLKRYHIDFIIIEKNQIGGMLYNAGLIENYPGFPGGITGLKMVKLIEKQIQENKIEILKDTIEEANFANSFFHLRGAINNYEAEILIVATGTKAVKVFDYSEAIATRVYYEFYPLSHIQNKHIGIIGAGDAAFDYAISLSKNNNKVSIFNRTDIIKALPLLKYEVESNPNINYYPRHTLVKISGRTELNLSFSEVNSTYFVDYIIFATGRKPETSFLNNELLQIEKELIKNNKLFYIGDVKNGSKRQLAIAAGNGVECAMQIASLF